ncbi:unnamed protein product, partial [marine sediment metagenome]
THNGLDELPREEAYFTWQQRQAVDLAQVNAFKVGATVAAADAVKLHS